MTIEIKITACNVADMARQLADVERRVNDLAPADAPTPPADLPLQELIDLTTERAKAAGFTIEITPVLDEAPAAEKKPRKVKAAPAPEVEEADKPEETAYSGDSEELKKEVIAKCSQLMLDGRRDVVMALKKEFGRTLSDLPADRFPAIAKKLEEILNDGEHDQ